MESSVSLNFLDFQWEICIIIDIWRKCHIGREIPSGLN